MTENKIDVCIKPKFTRSLQNVHVLQRSDAASITLNVAIYCFEGFKLVLRGKKTANIY